MDLQNTDNQPINENEVGKESIDWLKEIAGKSFEPELLISGAAIYLSSGLPASIEWLFENYVHNLVADIEAVTATLPTLIYAFLKSNAYILIYTFIFHFILRAFWVGMVGLLSVYPKGIDYQNFPKYYSSEMKDVIQKRMTSTEHFILSLDKQCSIIFSLAFMMVMLFVGISMLYFLIVVLYALLELLIPAGIFKNYQSLIFFGLMFLLVAPSLYLAILSLPGFKGKPKYEKIKAHWQWDIQKYMIPVLGLVIFRLSLIFQTNTRYNNRYLIGLTVGFLIVVMFLGVMRYRRFGELWDTRNYYSKESEAYTLDAKLYDNLRPQDKFIEYVSIQADVIKDNFLRLFLVYPKRLDIRLKAFCPPPIIDKKLPRATQNELKDAYYLACVGRFHKIYLNDSLQKKLDFVYHRHPQTGEKGFLTYLDLQSAKRGKNQLRIMRPDRENLKKDTAFYIIPFYHFPN
jgi:hypothetical protein